MLGKIFLILFTVLSIANAVIFLVSRDMDYLVLSLLFLVVQMLHANNVVR